MTYAQWLHELKSGGASAFIRQKKLLDEALKKCSAKGQMEAISKVESIIGLPDYVAMLGKKGPLYARELLDKNMPDRASFADLEDNKILEALTKKPGEKGNPFEMEEYKKPVYKEDHQLDNSLREFKTRENAKQQKTL